MTRKTIMRARAPLLLGLALAIAVLALPQGGAGPASAQLPEAPHYKCYSAVGGTVVEPVTVETQFGEELVGVNIAGDHVCPPALKNGEGDLGWPDLRCYNVVPPAPNPGHTVNLSTQFGVEENVQVGEARMLCGPFLKDGAPPPLPTVPHYLCYDIDGPPPAVPPVDLETPQFPPEPGVVVEAADLLCAPALKNGEGDLTVPHLKCYNISGPPLGLLIGVHDQFGVISDVVVEEPQQLCVPAEKLVRGVGGVAELPLTDTDTAADAASAPPDGSGLSTGAWVAIATGAAALIVAFAGGGLYAVRRRIR